MATVSELYRVQQGHTYAGNTDLKVMCCPSCGVTYAIPAVLQKAAHDAGHRKIVWYCPNGHELGYNGESEDEKKAREFKEEADWQRQRAGRLAADLDQTKASLRAQKGATTKAKKRHAAALCPCCNRSFKQLRAHYRMHPDYEPERA